MAVCVLYESNPVTVNVLPISEREFAKEPGRLLPFVIATFASFKAIVVIVPSAAVTVNVEFAPSSSVKK